KHGYAAAFHLSGLLALQPDNLDLRQRRSQACGWQGATEQALADANVVVAGRPHDPEAWSLRGAASASGGRGAGAVTGLRTAAELAREDAGHRFALGLAYLGAGDERGYHDLCRGWLRRLVRELDTAEADTVLWLASVGPAAGDVEELLQQAIGRLIPD